MHKNWFVMARTIGVQLATPIRQGLLNRSRFSLLVLLIVAMCSGAWAVCSTPPLYVIHVTTQCYFPSSTQNGCGRCCQNTTIPSNVVVTSSFYSNSSGPGMPYACGCRISNPLTTTASGSAGYATGYVCDNECEADSLRCVNEGKEWTNTGAETCGGKSCQNCPNDTTWQEKSCAYSPQRGLYLNVVNIYSVVNCETSTRSYQYYSAQCDSTKVPSCTADDADWLDSAKSACQSIQGTNDFAIIDTNDVCEHRGHCCTLDSLIDGEGCRWRCEAQDSLCTLKKGNFSYAIVADTAVSGSDTTYTGLCYNNCFMYASKDSLTGIVTGNVTAVDNTSMGVGTYYPDGFKGIRSDYGGIYTYDFLSDENYEWADSLLSAPCSVGMYRGIKNGKYVYWKSGQPVPEGVTNVVKVK